MAFKRKAPEMEKLRLCAGIILQEVKFKDTKSFGQGQQAYESNSENMNSVSHTIGQRKPRSV